MNANFFYLKFNFSVMKETYQTIVRFNLIKFPHFCIFIVAVIYIINLYKPVSGAKSEITKKYKKKQEDCNTLWANVLFNQ